MASGATNPYLPSHAEFSPGPIDAPHEQPTRVRYFVLVYSFGMSVLLYLDRFAMTVALPEIRGELQLDNQDMGHVTSAFFYVYALAQVPTGWMSDRWGARITLPLYVFLWSLALIGMSTATGLASLILFRSLLGLAQAGAYPCAASNNKNWFPISRRGFANSLVAMGGRAGNLMAVTLTPYLMLLVGLLFGWTTGQWRPVFCLYGLLGLFWSIGFRLQCRDRPRQHPGCNAAERQLIEGTLTVPTDPASFGDKLPSHQRSGAGGVLREFGEILMQIIISPTMWLMCIISVLVNVGWIFLVTFLPTYFREVHGIPLSTIGFLAAIPTIASMMGGLSGGVAADRFVRRYGLVWGRRLTGAIASGAAAAVYCVALAADHWLLLIALFAAIGFLIDFGLGALWAVYQDIAGPRVAAVLGFANMCGNLSAAYFSGAIGGFAKAGQWRVIFLIAAASLACNLLLWMFVSPNRKMNFGEERTEVK